MNAPSQRKFQLGYKWYQHDFQVFKFSWTQTEKVPWSHCVSNTLSSTRRQHGKWMPGCRLFFHMMMGISFHTCIMCIGARQKKKNMHLVKASDPATIFGSILLSFTHLSTFANHINSIYIWISSNSTRTAPKTETFTNRYYMLLLKQIMSNVILRLLSTQNIYIYITIHNICH